MNQVSDHDVALAMRSMGGSFATRLAECWLFADDQNRARITAAFPDFWQQYRELAELKATA